jgi:hypothetical protein
MYLSICFFIALSWLFVGAEQGKMKLLLLRYIAEGYPVPEPTVVSSVLTSSAP